jgi:hypothetical protein
MATSWPEPAAASRRHAALLAEITTPRAERSSSQVYIEPGKVRLVTEKSQNTQIIFLAGSALLDEGLQSS